MTPLQERFVKEYLVSNSAQEAAIKAGYSPKHAEKEASRVLSYPHVKKAVEECRRQAMQQVTQQVGMSYAEKMRINQELLKDCAKNKKTKDYATLLRVDNEMQGHNAPTQNLNVNVTTSAEALNEMMKKYKSEV